MIGTEEFDQAVANLAARTLAGESADDPTGFGSVVEHHNIDPQALLDMATRHQRITEAMPLSNPIRTSYIAGFALALELQELGS